MKVLTVGVFDLLHFGHVNLFKRAKSYGDYLIVAVQESDVVKKFKPEANLLFDTDLRIFMVESIRYVDEVITYRNVADIVRITDFDIFAVGPDQCHEGFQNAIDWCKSNNKLVIVIPRTDGVSSSQLKGYKND